MDGDPRPYGGGVSDCALALRDGSHKIHYIERPSTPLDTSTHFCIPLSMQRDRHGGRGSWNKPFAGHKRAWDDVGPGGSHRGFDRRDNGGPSRYHGDGPERGKKTRIGPCRMFKGLGFQKWQPICDVMTTFPPLFPQCQNHCQLHL